MEKGEFLIEKVPNGITSLIGEEKSLEDLEPEAPLWSKVKFLKPIQKQIVCNAVHELARNAWTYGSLGVAKSEIKENLAKRKGGEEGRDLGGEYEALPADRKAKVFVHIVEPEQKITFGVRDPGKGFDTAEAHSSRPGGGISITTGYYKRILEKQGVDLDLKFRSGKKGTMAVLEVSKKK